MNNKTTILIDKTTRELLKSLGSKGETYNTIILRIEEENVKLEQKIQKIKTLLNQFPNAQTEESNYIGENVDNWLSALQRMVRDEQ